MVQCGFGVFGVHLAAISLSRSIDFTQDDTFPPVHRLATLLYAENYLSSLVVFAAWVKLFDYLRVFSSLNALIVMIKAMARKLNEWFILFCVVILAFTCAE
jgi:hypothetical protein